MTRWIALGLVAWAVGCVAASPRPTQTSSGDNNTIQNEDRTTSPDLLTRRDVAAGQTVATSQSSGPGPQVAAPSSTDSLVTVQKVAQGMRDELVTFILALVIWLSHRREMYRIVHRCQTGDPQ